MTRVMFFNWESDSNESKGCNHVLISNVKGYSVLSKALL